jgi:stage II sporulation protein M
MRVKDLPERINWPLSLPLLFVATGTLFAFGALGYAVGGQPQAQEFMESLAATLRPLQDMGSAELMLLIFVNNAVKAGGVILLGVLLGIPPFIFLVTNGLVVGVAIYQIAAERGLGFVLAGLAPHGVVELPALLVATALGLGMGVEVSRWLRRRPSRVRRRLGRSVRIYLFWVAPALAVAAVIEVLVTPLLLGRF